MASDICCRHEVFHHDIKLENLLINTETLKVKLIDLGCGDLLQISGYSRFYGKYSAINLQDLNYSDKLNCINHISNYTRYVFCTLQRQHAFIFQAYPSDKSLSFRNTGSALIKTIVCGRFPKPRDMQMISHVVWWELGLSKHKIAFITTKKTNCVSSLGPGGPTSCRVSLQLVLAYLEDSSNPKYLYCFGSGMFNWGRS